MVASIKPEYLLDSHDYHYFVQSKKEKSAKNRRSSSKFLDPEEDKYELISRKAWTDLLLQITKVSIFKIFVKFYKTYFNA